MKSTTLVQTFNNLRFGHGLARKWVWLRGQAAANRKRKLSVTKGPRPTNQPPPGSSGEDEVTGGAEQGQSLPKLQPKYPMGCLIKVSPRGYPFTSTLARTSASTAIPRYKYSSRHRAKRIDIKITFKIWFMVWGL